MTKKPESRGDEGAFYRTLLESTRAIPWRIDWDTKTFSYIGPQIEHVLGWAPESWVSIQDWADRIAEAAHHLAIKCRDAVHEAAIEHQQGGPSRLLTVSMGVVASIPRRDEENPKALIREVDRRLYLAKKRGRDSIVGDAEARQESSRS